MTTTHPTTQFDYLTWQDMTPASAAEKYLFDHYEAGSDEAKAVILMWSQEYATKFYAKMLRRVVGDDYHSLLETLSAKAIERAEVALKSYDRERLSKRQWISHLTFYLRHPLPNAFSQHWATASKAYDDHMELASLDRDPTALIDEMLPWGARQALYLLSRGESFAAIAEAAPLTPHEAEAVRERVIEPCLARMSGSVRREAEEIVRDGGERAQGQAAWRQAWQELREREEHWSAAATLLAEVKIARKGVSRAANLRALTGLDDAQLLAAAEETARHLHGKLDQQARIWACDYVGWTRSAIAKRHDLTTADIGEALSDANERLRARSRRGNAQ